MKTDDFIAALAADPTLEQGFAQRAWPRAALAATLAAVLFYAAFGLRAGLSRPPVIASIAMKLAFTAPLAASALFAAARLSHPGASRAKALAVLLVPLLAIAALLAFDLSQNGLDGWRARLFGATSSMCAPLIALLSALPLAALVAAMRAGAPEEPPLAGALVGLAAAGLGASVYAFHCPEDSPLFMAAWYSLAALIVAGAGAYCGRWLRW